MWWGANSDTFHEWFLENMVVLCDNNELIFLSLCTNRPVFCHPVRSRAWNTCHQFWSRAQLKGHLLCGTWTLRKSFTGTVLFLFSWSMKILHTSLNPRNLEEKIVHEHLRMGGQSDPFFYFWHNSSDWHNAATYNKLPLCFQLSETSWCLTGFHGN